MNVKAVLLTRENGQIVEKHLGQFPFHTTISHWQSILSKQLGGLWRWKRDRNIFGGYFVKEDESGDCVELR